MSGDLLTTALDAAERGWHVFPLRPDTKRPAVRGWEARATTDPARINRCWSAGPYGIGVACGPSALVVVDLDAHKTDATPPVVWRDQPVRHGADVLAVLASAAGQPMPGEDGTYQVATGSNGRHLYYAAPDGAELRNTAGRLGWLIDTRARGGYVVAAGSVVAGNPYRVATDGPVVKLPAWLAVRLTSSPPPPASAGPVRIDTGRHDAYVTAAIRAEVARVVNEPDNHNGALYIAACALGQLAAGGVLTEPEVRDVLMTAFSRHIAAEPHHHNEREADATITSGLKAGAKRPRRVAA